LPIELSSCNHDPIDVVRFAGVVTADDLAVLRHHWDQCRQWRVRRPVLFLIAGGASASELSVPVMVAHRDGLLRLAERDGARDKAGDAGASAFRLAMVCQDESTKMFLRMWQAMSDGAPNLGVDRRIFEDLAGALTWLGFAQDDLELDWHLPRLLASSAR